jgi:HAD superfamily hydrolase (TIGR01459 family)
VAEQSYDNVITSGEVTFEYINSNYQENKYYIINSEEADLLEDSNMVRTHDVKDADFILLIGFESYNQTLSDMLPFLDKCLKYNKKIICANPDKTVTDIEGNIYLCAGIIADKYKQMGGEVIYFGKPYSQIYSKVLSLFDKIDKKRIVAIGDNIETDIKGASNSGLDSYLIPGGIHANSLNISHGEIPFKEKYSIFLDEYKIYPNGILGSFIF